MMNNKTKNTYLAYFDILGWKKIVERLSNEKLDFLYEQIMARTQHSYADSRQIVGNTLIAKYKNTPVKAINVSDSIVFFTDDASETSLRKLLETVSDFALKLDGLCSYRGCLVYGSLCAIMGGMKNENEEIAYNVSAIYGKALIDGYQKAEAQEWIGCFIDDSVVNYATENSFSKEVFKRFIEYEVPFKIKEKCKENPALLASLVE